MSDKKPLEEPGYSRNRVNRVLKKVGLKAQHVNPSLLRVYLQHLNVWMFDAQGQRLLVCYLVKVIKDPNWFIDIHTKDPDENVMGFLLISRVEIDKAIYGSNPLTYPLILEHKINYIKRTSVRFTVNMKQQDQSRDLVTATWVEVNIDPVTKQPKVFPVWWKNQLGVPEKGPPIEIQPAPKPILNVFSDKRKIYFNDTDENNHTNYESYLRMCLDSFYQNVLHGKYINASPALLNGWVKTLTVTFKGDSVLDDVLTINSWEDPRRYNTYHFEITNNDTVILLISIEFYTSITYNSHL